MSGLERGLACHPSLRSGSRRAAGQILHFVQDDSEAKDDKSYLQIYFCLRI